jgi:hypothetical protein
MTSHCTDRTRHDTPRLRGTEKRLFQNGRRASVSQCVVTVCAAALMWSSTAAAQSIAEIRVHGNHTTPEADIISLAALSVGDAATDGALEAAQRRLVDSGRFDAVEVRRRLRSISDPSAILVILLVDERAAVTPEDLIPGPLKRVRAAGMWMPILTARDGYGVTYGARVAIIRPLGAGSRISMPLTWGGERRAAVEVERTFERGPLTVLRGTAAVYRRMNPHFDEPDRRRELSFMADRVLARWLRVGADARGAHVNFSGAGERHTAAGGHVVFDTRVDPSFPRNALHAMVAWERLGVQRRAVGIWNTDVSGYRGIGGSAVLALRAQSSRADAPLPPSERRLLGGTESLRGYRAGHRAGDRLAAVSLEVRQPFTSPLNYGRFGVKAFVDAGTVWNAGERLRSQHFDRGVGGGLYVGATAVTGNIDVAWPRDGKPRIHLGFGVSF